MPADFRDAEEWRAQPALLLRGNMFLLMWCAKSAQPVSLSSGELMLVGRGETCGVVVDDPSASRIHCRLLARDGKVFLTDAGSRWGTFVNGKRVAECELRPGDEITIGETVLRLAAEGTPDGTTLARQSEVRQPFDRDEPPMACPTRHNLSLAGPATIEPERFDSPSPLPPRDDQSVLSPQPEASPPAVASESAPPVQRPVDQGPLPPAGAKWIGRRFLNCAIQELLARTASGHVFLATEAATGQRVALKIFDPALMSDDISRRRFVRAVEATRGLRHPHLVTLWQAGIEQELCYTISEFVEGESAAALIQRIGVVGMLDWRTTLRIAIDIAAALVYAEEQGIVHRNITPRNILIRRSDGAALLNDLLLARSLDETASARLTQPGELLGAIPFQSPEQLGSGQPLDHRSDLYQLGATLYALLTGRPPLEGRTTAELIQRVLTEPPVPPSRIHLAVPALLEGVILRLLARRPDDRYSSAEAALKDLERVRRYLGESDNE